MEQLRIEEGEGEGGKEGGRDYSDSDREWDVRMKN